MSQPQAQACLLNKRMQCAPEFENCLPKSVSALRLPRLRAIPSGAAQVTTQVCTHHTAHCSEFHSHPACPWPSPSSCNLLLYICKASQPQQNFGAAPTAAAFAACSRKGCQRTEHLFAGCHHPGLDLPGRVGSRKLDPHTTLTAPARNHLPAPTAP